MDALRDTNVVLAKLLDQAMTNGVSHWSLEFKDLGLPDRYATFFFPCVRWLEAEGLIRVEEYAQTMGGKASGSVENISLTSKGMAVLGEKIEVNGEPEPLSSAVQKVAEGKLDYNKVADALGGFIGGLIKSLGT